MIASLELVNHGQSSKKTLSVWVRIYYLGKKLLVSGFEKRHALAVARKDILYSTVWHDRVIQLLTWLRYTLAQVQHLDCCTLFFIYAYCVYLTRMITCF